MGVPVYETANDDDATRLVLDIVHKVLEPVAVKDAAQRTNCNSRQNYYVNANINYMNASININYKRWSTNDGNEQQPVIYSGHCNVSNMNNSMHDENALRAPKSNRYHKMNFWDQYSGENTVLNPMNMNQRGLQSTQHFVNQNYLNNRFSGKNSWRENPVYSNNCYNQLQQQQNQQPNMQPNLQQQQPIKPDNNFYQYRKNIRRCCSFCRKNGEAYEFYTTHSLYENGKPSCPVLRQCVCNICGQSGHTMSHCHMNASKNSILKMIHRFNMMK